MSLRNVSSDDHDGEPSFGPARGQSRAVLIVHAQEMCLIRQVSNPHGSHRGARAHSQNPHVSGGPFVADLCPTSRVPSEKGRAVRFGHSLQAITVWLFPIPVLAEVVAEILRGRSIPGRTGANCSEFCSFLVGLMLMSWAVDFRSATMVMCRRMNPSPPARKSKE